MYVIEIWAKRIIGFCLGLVFLVGLLSVCDLQVQLVQGGGVQLVPLAVAQEPYED